jgi:hypothetical protein
MQRRNFLRSSLAVVSGGLIDRSLASGALHRPVQGGALLRPGRAVSAAGPPSDARRAQEGPPESDAAYETLKAAFLKPGNDSHDWTRWWWFGPNAAEQGIAYELEQMQKQGLGGVEMQWMTPLEVEGNFDFLSDRWAQLVKFTVQKAKELGLRVDFTLGTGWPYGGPWIPIELGSQCIKMTLEAEQGPNGYGVRIPGELGEHEKLIGLFAAQTLGSDDVLDPNTIQDLRPFLRYSDPNFWAVVRPPVGWAVPPGRWKVISLKQMPTRQPVRTAALGDEGLVLNHFSRQALDRHLEVCGGAFKKAIGDEFGKTVRAVFCDSFEIHLPLHCFYWTEGLLEEFQKRQGYDLQPHLLALWFDVGDKTPRIRHDFIQTLSQVIIDNFFVPLRQWCEENNLKSRVQSHGSVAELMEGYGVNSIPEGEQVTTGEPTISVHRKYASSAAHIYGHPLVSAESFTFIAAPGYGSSYRFTNNLELMKSVLDPGLRDGYQEIVNHGYSYNDPDEKLEPFIEMYASAVIRHTEPWWQYYNHFTSYLARSCSLLAQGHFVGDVAVLSPIPDAWSKATVPRDIFWSPEGTLHWGDLAPLIVRAGYDFNFVNDQVLVERSKLASGKLRIGEMEHSVLVLPNISYIALRTLERVKEFCQSGGVVIATERVPEFATGFAGYVDRDKQVQAIVRELFGEIPAKEQMVRRKVGQGEALFLRSLADLPKVLRTILQPDFGLLHRSDAILHLHRRHGDVDVYFVTNNSESPQENTATFRVGRKIPELWNAETGECRPAPVYSLEKEGVRIPLRMKSYESAFYVFREIAEPVHVIETNAEEIVSEGPKVVCRLAGNGTCYIHTSAPSGKSRRLESPIKDLPAPLDVTGEWRVTFEAYKFPKLVKQMTVLQSWTDNPDIRHFSGTARYELEFEVPANYLGKGRKLILDLGTVADASKVFVNGHPAGVIWKRPHQHEVTKWINPGRNFLEVRVSNRLINAVGGMKRPEWVDKVIEKYGAYNERREWYDTNVREYGTEDIPLAGLLGPVRLIALQEAEFTLA